MAIAATRLDEDAPDWARFTLYAIGAALVLRWGILALELAPLHFDEAQYWSYGEALDLGYYSKPPLAAWLIRLSTEAFGDTVFGVRFFAPVAHAWIAWLLFATGRRLFDARAGFWASILYLTLPGVTVSSGLMTTDPPMMVGWAGALYALVRALQAEEARAIGDPHGENRDEPLFWWALVGAAVGAGLLAKYTAIAFVGGGIGYALFSRQGSAGARWPIDWRGPGLAILGALLVFSPNLYWNAANDFAAFAHVGDNAKLGGGAALRPDNAIEFVGAQAMIFGPVALVALGAMLAVGGWRGEWSYRLLLWLTLPLILAMTLQAFLSRAHPNWAAPAYVAGSLAVAAWLLDRERVRVLQAAVGSSLAIGLGFYALAGVYAAGHADLPR
ncbi:MAG: glycosyltransferase family 39 protein, partial [Pseudomonadota bacterium]